MDRLKHQNVNYAELTSQTPAVLWSDPEFPHDDVLYWKDQKEKGHPNGEFATEIDKGV